ncbi:HYR domain-containing protein [Salinimicrobium tongyeongense]|uniref:HYR domain-containing protein n=1 Tax=Salinimicrobium tongyeongense TaxID=2809707 RepID=A0ABY6NR90_9FLAO|nr:HYR domain-containing protein [Salinimicrobium tongyeongense]UZH55299.1 HYR domain-containing protein [Salinimicrobium tongyeongense]
MGLEFDSNDNLYVADYYNGTDPAVTEPSRVKIYYTNGDFYEFFGRSPSNKFNSPYRLFIDENFQLIVADLGSVNGRVQIFDVQTPKTPVFLPEGDVINNSVDSPGSITVDNNGFIYIGDFGPNVNITEILNLEGGSVQEIAATFSDVSNGIQYEEFSIKVFDSSLNFRTRIISEIDLPVDLSLKQCGSLLVNNATLSGSLPFDFKFDLEYYNRLPDTFTADLTIAAECTPATVSVEAGIGIDLECQPIPAQVSNTLSMIWDQTVPEIDCTPAEVVLPRNGQGKYILPDYSNRVSDNCDPNIAVTQIPLPGEITQGGPVTISAEDAAGNTSSCSFTVKLEAGPAPTFSCPDLNEIPELELDANCTYQETDFGYLLSNFQNFTSDEFLVQTVTRQENVLEVKIKVYDGENGNYVDECNFDVSLVDNTAPSISCPSQNIVETVPFGETGKKIDYTVTYGDNCSGATIKQTSGLASGEVFPVGLTITNTFVVTDASGLTATCSFTVTVSESNDLEDPKIICPTDIEVLADPEECGAVVEYDWPTAIDNAGEPIISIINGAPVSGSIFPVGPTEIVFEARDAAGNIDTCTLTITVIDEEAPVFTTCPSGTERTITAVNGQFIVPDLLGEVKAEDNCTSDAAITYSQEPGAGEEIFSNTTLKIYAFDENGKESAPCEIQLIVDNDEDELEIICPANSTPSFGDNCAFELPDYTRSATVNSATALVTQNPPAGSLIYGRTEITLTATEGGETAGCTFVIDPVDDVKPVITCRNDLEIHLNKDGFGIIPPEILLSTLEDNCGIDNVSLSISRFETSDAGENDILVTVVDINGNVETCEATVNVLPYDPLKDVGCVDSVELPLGPGGYAELSLHYTGEEEDIQLELSKKDFTCDDIGLPQTITATYFGEYTGSCEVEVNVVDNLAPLVNCISEIDLILDENGQGQLSVEDIDLNSTDNCKIEDMFLSKGNFTTEDVGTQTVRFTVTDASGNSDFCEVNVNVRPFMGTNGELNCVEEITLQLNNDGNAILKAEDLFDGDPAGLEFYGETTYTCEDLGENYITFSKKGDPAQNCEIKVVVEDNIAPVAGCVADFVLMLGENGTASLSPQDLEAGSTDNCEIASMSLDRTSFTTADIGTQQLVLTVTDSSGNSGSCETSIEVQAYKENPSGVECKDLFVLPLDTNGTAELQPQDLFTGNMSGTYDVSQSLFTCQNLGENEVTFTYSTANGKGTCTVKVMVEDPQNVCENPPAPESDYLIMYPNPGDGLVSFELSPGLKIERIEVFDFRGRFLREQQYDNSQPIPEYQLDLSAYQAGVYPLMIYTNGREYLKRAIIR